MQSDSDKLKQTERSHAVVYPGVSRPIGNKKHKEIATKPLPTPSIGRNIESKLEQKRLNENLLNQSKQKEISFNLDWIDSTSYPLDTNKRDNPITNSSGKKYFSLSNFKSDRPKNNYIGEDCSQNSLNNITLSKNNLLTTLSAKMQSNPGTTNYIPSNEGSTTLDMGNTELLTQTPDIYFDDQNLDGQLIDGSPEVKKNLSDDYNHLDEPILDTLMRDLTGIYNKMKIIALPLSSYDIYKVVLRGWDLWGPLLLCTFLAFNLHHSESRDNHMGPHFADVFVLVWFGSCIVSLNYRLLSISSINNRTITNQMNQAKASAGAPQNESAGGGGVGGDSTNPKQAGSGLMMSQYDAPFQTLHSPPSVFQLMCVLGYCLVVPCFGLILLKIFSFDRLFFERIVIGLLFGFAWPTFCSVRILIRYQHPNKRALAIYPIGLFYFVLSCMIILNH